MGVKLLLISLFMICGCTQVDYDIPSSNEITLAVPHKREIWTVDINGKNRKRLLKDGEISWGRGVSWSPDGKKIIFIEVEREKNFSKLKMIDMVEKKINKVLEKEGWIDDISWFPKGEKIILVWQKSVYSFNIKHQKLQKIVDNKLVDGRSIRFPSLSPDGNNIVFQTNYKSDRPKAWIMNLDKKEVKRLSDNPPEAREMKPVWSPDGKWIAFQEMSSKSKRHGHYLPIVLINPKTNQRYEIPLLKGMFIDDINFSPDGKKIILSTMNGGIYIIDIDTRRLKELIPPSLSLYGAFIKISLSWRPIAKSENLRENK